MRGAYLSNLSMVETIAKAVGYRETGHEQRAAEALTAGQPAFYSAQGYSNAKASSLLFYANHCRSLAAGNKQMNAAYQSDEDLSEAVLDWFIPLNEPAVREMLDLYEMAGTFRTANELRRRVPSTIGRVAA